MSEWVAVVKFKAYYEGEAVHVLTGIMADDADTAEQIAVWRLYRAGVGIGHRAGADGDGLSQVME